VKKLSQRTPKQIIEEGQQPATVYQKASGQPATPPPPTQVLQKEHEYIQTTEAAKPTPKAIIEAPGPTVLPYAKATVMVPVQKPTPKQIIEGATTVPKEVYLIPVSPKVTQPTMIRPSLTELASKVDPFGVLGGFVYMTESPIYSIAESAGLKLTSRVPEVLMKPGFFVGMGVGMIASGIALGEVTAPVFEALPSAIAKPLLGTVVGRTALAAGFGASYSAIMTKGEPRAVLMGAGFGAAFSLGTEFVGRPLLEEAKGWLGIGERLEVGVPTKGYLGEEVPTYVSKQPLSELGDKYLRVVAGVGELPEGRTVQSLVAEYTGEYLPTAHATLEPEYFDLGKGGETLLKGFPGEAKGFRSAWELYHFYSAPGSEEFVTVYGGYLGLGAVESEVAPKVVFGGRPTALVTLKTEVSPEFLRLPGETEAAWMARISRLTGQTGVPPETLGGKSPEWQLITPSSYTRFGEELPGSMYVSAGKVGTFQIKEVPEALKDIPILRTMFAKYTDIDVYLGKYMSVSDIVAGDTPKTLDIGEYAHQPMISVPSRVVYSPLLASLGVSDIVSPRYISKPIESFISKPSKPSLPSEVSSISKSASKQISEISKSSDISRISDISKISFPSYPSEVSYPSKPSYPSYPSYPSRVSEPSLTMPKIPQLLTPKGKRKVRIKEAPWLRKWRLHPIATPKEVKKMMVGK
jgi:hypothetical protein